MMTIGHVLVKEGKIGEKLVLTCFASFFFCVCVCFRFYNVVYLDSAMTDDDSLSTTSLVQVHQAEITNNNTDFLLVQSLSMPTSALIQINSPVININYNASNPPCAYKKDEIVKSGLNKLAEPNLSKFHCCTCCIIYVFSRINLRLTGMKKGEYSSDLSLIFRQRRVAIDHTKKIGGGKSILRLRQRLSRYFVSL